MKYKKRPKTTVPVGNYSIEEVMTFREENKISDRVRFMTYLIERDGTKCKCCGKEGTHFEARLWHDKLSGIHLDLYADDGSLLTRDHIIPKSKGGEDTIDNFQILCETCNTSKGGQIMDNVAIPQGASDSEKTIIKLLNHNQKLRLENLTLQNTNDHRKITIEHLEKRAKLLLERIEFLEGKKSFNKLAIMMREEVKNV